MLDGDWCCNRNAGKKEEGEIEEGMEGTRVWGGSVGISSSERIQYEIGKTWLRRWDSSKELER